MQPGPKCRSVQRGGCHTDAARCQRHRERSYRWVCRLAECRTAHHPHDLRAWSWAVVVTLHTVVRSDLSRIAAASTGAGPASIQSTRHSDQFVPDFTEGQIDNATRGIAVPSSSEMPGLSQWKACINSACCFRQRGRSLALRGRSLNTSGLNSRVSASFHTCSGRDGPIYAVGH